MLVHCIFYFDAVALKNITIIFKINSIYAKYYNRI